MSGIRYEAVKIDPKKYYGIAKSKAEEDQKRGMRGDKEERWLILFIIL